MTTHKKSAKERARPTSIAGGPGTNPSDHEDRERSTEQQASDADQASHFRTTSLTEMEKQIAQESEGGMAARTPHEMSLHDELARTPTSSDGDQGAKKREIHV